MKHITAMLAFLACMMVTVACKDSKTEDEPLPEEALQQSYLEVTPTSVELGGDIGTSATVNLKANADWFTTSSPEWVSLSTSSGQGDTRIVVTATSKNNSLDAREGKIIFKCDDKSVEVKVKQRSGLKTDISTNVSDLLFSSTSDFSQTITVRTDVEWELIGLPNWLKASSLSGNGETSITLTTKSENATASERSATLTFQTKVSASINVKVQVKQEAGLSPCNLYPGNVTILSDAFAWHFTPSVNTQYYYYKVMLKKDADRKLDSEIIADLKGGTRYLSSDNYFFYFSNAEPNTEYLILSVAFDKNNKQGELLKYTVKTRETVGLDAYVAIQSVSKSNKDLKWSTAMSASCKEYYMLVSTDGNYDSYLRPSIYFAYLMKYMMDYQEFNSNWNASLSSSLLHPGSFEMSIPDGASYYFIATWGKFSDGKLSPTVVYKSGKYPGSSNAPAKTQRNNVNSTQLPYGISVSVKMPNKNSYRLIKAKNPMVVKKL